MRYTSTLVAMALFTFALAACSQQSQTQETQADESAQATSVEPARYEIEANSDGYVPAMVHAAVGQEVTLVFKRTTDATCATEVVMPSQDVKVDLPLNEPVEVTFIASEAGVIDFSCGMNMWHGKVMVD
jgi:plastocyanin domain-containing protein